MSLQLTAGDTVAVSERRQKQRVDGGFLLQNIEDLFRALVQKGNRSNLDTNDGRFGSRLRQSRAPARYSRSSRRAANRRQKRAPVELISHGKVLSEVEFECSLQSSSRIQR